MTDQMKPPPRRRPSGGRVLGAGQTVSTAPPAAELTREQLEAEQAAEPARVVAAPAPAPQQPVQAQPEPTAQPAPGPTAGAETSPAPAAAPQQDLVQAQAEPPVGVPPGYQATTAGQPPPPVSVSTAPAGVIPAGPAHQAELAVRAAALPAQGTGPFPVAAGQTSQPRQQGSSSHAAQGDGVPWTQGPGRPHEIPTAADVLNRRIITRESLDASVAADLRIKKRLKRFALDNELDHLPMGDIVTVALDEWLSARGY